MRKFILAIAVFCFLFCSCASHPVAGVWEDASLVAEQRAEIEQLKRDITDMGANRREISERIDSITAGLTDGLERCETINDIFTEIDRFVRELIDENNKLRSLQQSDRPADAGE
jgi:methyl-accepting chemotaxis protein